MHARHPTGETRFVRAFESPPHSPGRGRARLLVPAKHAQGAEGVPPARLAFALVNLDRHRAGVPGLERPPAIAFALGRDQLNRLGDALVGCYAGAAQVLESPQHVVVPPRREGETRPLGVGRTSRPRTRSNHLAGRPPAEEAPLEEILLPAETGLGHLRAAPAGSFDLEQSLEHADRGV